MLGSPEASLIVWHHGSIVKLVGHFPVVNANDVPGDWPKKRFVIVPQMLLADDAEVT